MTAEIPTLFIFVTPKVSNDLINKVYFKLRELQNPAVFGARYEWEIPALKSRFDPEKTRAWNSEFKECDIKDDDAFFGVVADEDRDDIGEYIREEKEFDEDLKMKYYIQPQTAYQKDVINNRDYYDYNEYYVADKDWMLVNISRPSNEPSFTTIVKQFTEVGYEPMFAYFFFSNQWGLLKGDYDFLKELWKQKGLEGEYDHSKILKKYVDKTLPAQGQLPEEEPQVFRGDFRKLVRMLDEMKDEMENITELKKIKS